MSKILIICQETEQNYDLTSLLNNVGYETRIAHNEDDVFRLTEEFLPDIAIIDTACSSLNAASICKKIKIQNQTNDIQIILLTCKDSSSEDILVGADGYITKPFSDSILIATVNAHLRIKKLLDILYTNNTELAKSLYQLNVLFNTSSQLAGTLDKTKLINIMNEGLEKSMNFSLCIALIINQPEDATLIINSLYPVSERLAHALKLRAMIGYKNLFENKRLPFELSINSISVEVNFKNQEQEYDLNILNYDSLFSPIHTADKFFGTVEVLRESDFTGEDSTCFQTVVNQVSLPLESAILYEEIKKTNIKLEKLEKLKSEFISIVSHELRTPLTAIKNSLDIMLSGKTGDITKIQNNFLTIAKRNVDRLTGIINDLLDLSKIEAGKMDYRFEPVNVYDPVSLVKSTFEHLAEKKNIKINLNIQPDLPQIYGDMSKIEQVLSNLVSNAVKFTPENGNITISAKKVNASAIDKTLFYRETSSEQIKKAVLKGNYVQIGVKDSGIGIKQADIPKVFDKFQQIENSLSREVGGTGLGLPIAKQLIEAHRGEIWLESEIDNGAEFSFILPVMNYENTFLIEFDQQLQVSKYNHSNLALILFEEKFQKNSPENQNSIIKDISSCKINFFIDYNKCKMFIQNNRMYLIIADGGKNDVERFIESLKEYLDENKFLYLNQSLKLGISIYPEDGITSEELIIFCEKSNYYLYSSQEMPVSE